DWATLSFVCLGGVGVVSVASHLVGERMHQMIELASTGDVPAARKIHEELLPLFKGLFITSNPIPVKAALEIVGRPAGPLRLPLVAPTRGARAVLPSPASPRPRRSEPRSSSPCGMPASSEEPRARLVFLGGVGEVGRNM